MFWKNSFPDKKTGLNSLSNPSKKKDPSITRLFEDILYDGSILRVKVTGRSMAPFLLGGEVATIKNVPCTSLHRGDLIFFNNSGSFFVLHRIVHKRKGSDGTITFLTKGDALISLDEPVRDRNVLGKICKIEKNNSRAEPKSLNMESRPWQSINFVIALTSLSRSALYYILGRLRKTAISVESAPLNYASCAVMNRHNPYLNCSSRLPLKKVT